MILDLDFSSFPAFSRTKREVAHLPLHATWIETRPARHNAFLKNLSQDRVMKSTPVLRGVLPRSSRSCAGPREQCEGMIACPGLRSPSELLHASSLGWQSVPSSGRKTPVAPNPESCCAALFWSHANES